MKMAKSTTVVLQPGYNMQAIVKMAEQQFVSQGYEVNSAVMGPQSATITILKDRDGIKNIAGLGVECKATLTVMGENTMMVNVESEWGNKILALALGWWLCLIPFITGLIGCSNQSGLPNKVISTIQAAAASSGTQFNM